MVQSFGEHFASARVEGVFMEYGSGQKYCVNGPTYQKNIFLSTAAITDSFRILPKNGLQKPLKCMVPSQYLSTQKDLAFPYLTWPMHQNFIRLLPKIQSQNT